MGAAEAMRLRAVVKMAAAVDRLLSHSSFIKSMEMEVVVSARSHEDGDGPLGSLYRRSLTILQVDTYNIQ